MIGWRHPRLPYSLRHVQQGHQHFQVKVSHQRGPCQPGKKQNKTMSAALGHWLKAAHREHGLHADVLMNFKTAVGFLGHLHLLQLMDHSHIHIVMAGIPGHLQKSKKIFIQKDFCNILFNNFLKSYIVVFLQHLIQQNHIITLITINKDLF